MTERMEDAYGPLPRAIEVMPSVGEAVWTLVFSTVWAWPWACGVAWIAWKVWEANR